MLQRHRHNYPVLNELENSPSGSNVLKALLMLFRMPSANSRVSLQELDFQDELRRFREEFRFPITSATGADLIGGGDGMQLPTNLATQILKLHPAWIL